MRFEDLTSLIVQARFYDGIANIIAMPQIQTQGETCTQHNVFSRLERASSEWALNFRRVVSSRERNHDRTKPFYYLVGFAAGPTPQTPQPSLHSRHCPDLCRYSLSALKMSKMTARAIQQILSSVSFTKKDSHWGSEVVYFPIASQPKILFLRHKSGSI